MSAAAVQVPEQDEMFAGGSPALVRQQAAEVLAAHRQRRQRHAGLIAEQRAEAERTEAGPSRAERIASRVSERYAQTQSYHAFLAAEAEEATRKAKAAAEIAARTAVAVAAVQRELLEELASSAAAEEEARVVREVARQADVQQVVSGLLEAEVQEQRTPPVTQVTREGLTVRLFEDVGRIPRTLSTRGTRTEEEVSFRSSVLDDSEEAQALDDEISFRQAPTFDLEHLSVSIPGNLLEFPRQLVAARKARPRFAEGPLREDGADEHGGVQLRIFEVEADQITQDPPVESATAEWSSIWLDELTDEAPEQASAPVENVVWATIEVASLERRIMAGIVDACLIGAGFVASATLFAYNVAVLPSPGIVAISAAGVLAAVGLMYQMLFFTLAEATPGMRYARIGLCTFEDANPTRTAMLGRMLATMVAVCPLGLGFLWALVDDDRIGWHDRISRMYQRSY